MAKSYRFHGVVGLNTEAGTVYLPAQEAAKLAASLMRAARSITSGESFAQSQVNGPEIADYSHTADAHNIGDALARGLIKARETAPNHWRASWRAAPGKRFKVVCNPAGLPLDYRTSRAAYSAACYHGGLES